MPSFSIHNEDCLVTMERLAAANVMFHSIVCDPPYHLTSIVKRFGASNAAPAKHGTDGLFARASRGFMGQQWDGGDIAFRKETWRLCWKLLPPGGYLLAFSGTRTYHRMVCAIEDAGFEIRDQMAWMFGTGFPKSHDVSKTIDKQHGAQREVVGVRTDGRGKFPTKIANHATGDTGIGHADGSKQVYEETAPATDEAKEWEGWGSALKPAWEPIVVARKPLEGTLVSNVLKHRVGALNINACRIETTDKLGGGMVSMGRPKASEGWDRPWMHDPEVTEKKKVESAAKVALAEELGRWPANVIHDGSDEVLEAFAPFSNGASVSRFFYCAKASTADRNDGVENNTHPTVKPTSLMEHLCKLVTPPGGTVFDPFAGSGSTGRGAVKSGFNFVGCELSPEYTDIAKKRIVAAGGAIARSRVRPSTMQEANHAA